MKHITGDKLQHEVIKTSQAFYRDQDISVEFGGETAMTNGKNVIIPSVPLDHNFTLDEAAVIRGFVDHEAGHGRHTNFNISKRNKTIKADMAKYEHYMPITNGIEDVRIERLIVKEYVGAKANIAHTSAYANNMYLELYEQDPSIAKDIGAVGAVAITWEGRRRIGYADPTLEKCLDTLPDSIRKSVEGVVDRIDKCKDTKGAFMLARDVLKEWGLDREKPEGDEPQDGNEKQDGNNGPDGGGQEVSTAPTKTNAKTSDEEDAEQPDGGGGAGKPGDGGEEDGPDVVVRASEEAFGKDQTGKGDGQGGGWGIGDGSGDSSKPARPAIEVNLEKTLTNIIPTGNSRGYTVLFGGDDQHVRPDSGGVLAEKLNEKTREAKRLCRFSNISEASSGHTNRMRRKMERALQSKMERTWRGGHEEGSLNGRALASALSGNQAIYRKRSDIEELDTCVTLLLDASSSMYGLRAKLATQSVVALSKLFDKMNIPFMVACFNVDGMHMAHPRRKHGWYEKRWEEYGEKHGYDNASNARAYPITVYMLKEFSDSLKSAQHRIAAYQEMVNGSNIDGCAIRQVADQYLLPRPEKKKILMTFSDGQPCGGSGEYGRLTEVVKSLTGEGVDCVGVGIQTDSVSQFYPNWVEVRDLEDLSKAAMDKIAKLLMGKRFKVDSRDAA